MLCLNNIHRHYTNSLFNLSHQLDISAYIRHQTHTTFRTHQPPLIIMASNNLTTPRPSQTRTPSHNIRTAEEVLSRFYDAEELYMASPAEKRDFAGLAATLSPNVLVHQSPDMPYGGEYKGHEGFLKWSEAMATCFDCMEVSERQVLHNGSEVVVTSTLKMRVRKSGEEVIGPLIQWIKVDRDEGTIKEIRPFYWNVRGVNEALGRGMYGQ